MLEGKDLVTIYSGEYYISSDSHVVIYTRLGSCVAVCLYDPITGVGGMNHFMLPQAQEDQASEHGRYGLQSMEMMIENLLCQGAVYQNLKAKIFGGGNMVSYNYRENDIALANISFTLKYLTSKEIPIISKGLGGTSGREIYYFLVDHSVYVKRLSREEK
jgi:chemotaxis protein CheD